MRSFGIVALLAIVVGSAGFLIGERKGRMDGREEVIQMFVSSQSRKDSEAANTIEVNTTIRLSSGANKEVTLLGVTLRASSGKEAIYRGGPLLLVVKPVENHDKTITITAKWNENTNATNSGTMEVPPVTIADGGTAIQQIGALRFSFAAKVLPK